MTKKQKEVIEAVEILKKWGLIDGTVISAKVNHVSNSGMSRNVGLYITQNNEIIDISYWASKALEWGYKEGYSGGVKVGGCGMDMLFHTIDCLSYAMGYGDICQERDRTKPIQKNQGIKAIGLKYKQL
ncbi:MAG: hypothetical protein WCH21_10910 [Bacteroidota bacterium]